MDVMSLGGYLSFRYSLLPVDWRPCDPLCHGGTTGAAPDWAVWPELCTRPVLPADSESLSWPAGTPAGATAGCKPARTGPGPASPRTTSCAATEPAFACFCAAILGPLLACAGMGLGSALE